jgi:hypothetical protein
MSDTLQTSTVAAMPDEFAFINDSAEVFHIAASLGRPFNAFFVHAVDGEYVEVWGMYGVIPTLNRPVYRVL